MYNSVTDSVHFTINLTQERVFIDRFYRINHAKTYNFDAPTLVTSASHKITAKMPYSLSKINIFDEETTFRHTFLSSDLQCLPPGDPRILCVKHTYPITGKSSIGSYKIGKNKWEEQLWASFTFLRQTNLPVFHLITVVFNSNVLMVSLKVAEFS